MRTDQPISARALSAALPRPTGIACGAFRARTKMFLLPPSPFPPSAPVLFSIRLRITAAHEKSVSRFPSAYFTLLCLGYAPSFTVPAFGARIILGSLLHRSRLRRPYYSRSACVSQRFMDDLCFRAKSSENLLLTGRVFLTFRRLISLCFVWVAHPPSPFLPSVPVFSLRSVCVCRSGL